MKNLLFIATEFPPGPGGIGTHAFHIATELSALGWRVTVVTPQEHASDALITCFRAQPHSFNLHRVRGRGFTKWLGYLRAARHYAPHADIILASGLRALWAAALTSHSYVAVVHGREIRFGGAWQQAITRWALQRAACLVPVSTYTAHRLSEAAITPRCLEVIPNGADASLYQPEVAPTPDHPHILTVGSLTRRKGQDVIIRALPDLPGAHYHMAGAPIRAAELRSLAGTLGVAKRITIHGIVPDLRPLYHRCAFFALTSRHTPDDFEGYGIAVQEAALCAKPAIVTADSGLEETVIHGLTGFIIPPDDPPAFAEAAHRLLSDGALRDQMGQAAREHARTWQAAATDYDTLLRGVL